MAEGAEQGVVLGRGLWLTPPRPPSLQLPVGHRRLDSLLPLGRKRKPDLVGAAADTATMGSRVSREDFEWVYTDQPHAARRQKILGEARAAPCYALPALRPTYPEAR